MHLHPYAYKQSYELLMSSALSIQANFKAKSMTN